jgi:hypothetical protein
MDGDELMVHELWATEVLKTAERFAKALMWGVR